jgi:hypothetical protein
MTIISHFIGNARAAYHRTGDSGAGDPRAGNARGGSRPAGRDLQALPLLVLAMLILAAIGYIVYVLWPRWPGLPASEAPELPITIGGIAFNIPTAAIRVPVQRRAGAHDRIDLAFLWPSLKPPDPAAKPAAPTSDQPLTPGNMLDRIFVTITAAGDVLAPDDRMRTIYPRYAAEAPVSGPAGLAILPFREGTPYQGEDLIYDAATPDNFLVRCTRAGAGPTPGICLYERRIEAADLVARFPRDLLGDWPTIAANLDRLIAGLRSAHPLPAGTQ